MEGEMKVGVERGPAVEGAAENGVNADASRDHDLTFTAVRDGVRGVLYVERR